ncbi:hypothetical protein PsorP6_016215 [Peronosclerospora sorghi]|uniref:Uncharacterized protein n=1 Tax=Peronosclerospora sorghi TaxID=230839 RepID=A0ACC0VQK3_9STRA|nr:hypothetical protein PsorP6_016215 [Peronosclerospora sorghi]
MGDFYQNDENVVDEKLWGEDSDDDEDRIDKENEKVEENFEVKGEALEDEARDMVEDRATTPYLLKPYKFPKLTRLHSRSSSITSALSEAD